MREYLRDGKRNRFDAEIRRADISRLFERFGDVFVEAEEGDDGAQDEDVRGGVVAFLQEYRPAVASWIADEETEIYFLPWDEDLHAAR